MKSFSFSSHFIGFLLFQLVVANVHAQIPTLEWANTHGGSLTDKGYKIEASDSGDIIVLGRFAGTVDFDPGSGVHNITALSGSVFQDAFIQSLDQNGNLNWVVSISPTISAIALDNSSNIYAVGEFVGTHDFDPGAGTFSLTSIGINDAFIMKLSPTGQFIWAKQIGGIGGDVNAIDVKIDQNGHVRTLGWHNGDIEFDPNTGTQIRTGYEDSYILELTSNGDFVSVIEIGDDNALGKERMRSFEIDDCNAIYVAGRIQGNCDLDPGAGVYNVVTGGAGMEAILIKLNPTSSITWARHFDTYGTIISSSDIHDITIDSLSNIYATGGYHDTIDFNTGTSADIRISNGNLDVFIAKLDSSGNKLWAKSIGGPEYDFSSSIKLDAIDNVYITGEFRDSVDFDPDTSTLILVSPWPSVVNAHRLFLGQYTGNNGNLVWAGSTAAGSTFSKSKGHDIEILETGGLLLTGHFEQTTGFDFGSSSTPVNSMGNADLMVAKYGLCYSVSSINANACDSYTSPSGLHEWTVSGLYDDTLTNINGCDSIIHIDLSINSIDSSVIMLDAITLEATASGAQYQWLDCNNNFAIMSGDTNQSFIAPSNGSYAVAVSQNGCTDTSACMIINSVGTYQNSLEEVFSVYPNPTSGSINIEFENAQESLTIRLLSITGKEIERRSIQKLKNVVIEIGEPAGIYFVEISGNEGQKATVRIIKG